MVPPRPGLGRRRRAHPHRPAPPHHRQRRQDPPLDVRHGLHRPRQLERPAPAHLHLRLRRRRRPGPRRPHRHVPRLLAAPRRHPRRPPRDRRRRVHQLQPLRRPQPAHHHPQGRDTVAHQRYGPADFAGGYHVLAVDWEPDGLTWYVDGTPASRSPTPRRSRTLRWNS
ncbi:family 16 glycosylhydrolase [Kitasatospora saccharophila]|uniref:family 16 glycosylhydrolase n=1 Tax=Kitasatospora saccharophila TaxID=407973 RepID=UPI003625D5BE